MKADPPDPVTSVFARRVRAGSEERYEEWLSGIAQAAARYPGSLGTTLLRPVTPRSEYVAVTQFDTADAMRAWLDSAERASWLARLRAIDVCHEEALTLAGMERWFTLAGGREPAPPRYKTAALVLLGLYPLVLGLDAVLGPVLEALPGPVGTLLSLAVSVTLMVWCVLPCLTRAFGWWLDPGECRERRIVRDGNRSGAQTS